MNTLVQVKEVYADLDYFVIARPEEYYLHVDVYPFLEGEAKVEGNSPGIRGEVKWDGCSNWDFHCDDGQMAHFCSKRMAVRMGELLGRIYDLAARSIPYWDGNES